MEQCEVLQDSRRFRLAQGYAVWEGRAEEMSCAAAEKGCMLLPYCRIDATALRNALAAEVIA
jgi:hypothetical protein